MTSGTVPYVGPHPAAGRKNIIFLTVVVLLHVCYYILALQFRRIYMGDSFEYIYEAVNIKVNGFFYSGNPALTIQPEYMTQRQPLYPLFLLGVYLFTINNWVVLLLQQLLSVFNIMYCRHVFQKMGLSTRFDWLLLILLAAYPAQFINACTIAPDILLQTCTVVYFGSFIAWWQQRRTASMVYMSLSLVAGMLVKPVLYPFVVVHFLLLLVCSVLWKQNMARALAIAFVPVAALLAYNYSNLCRTGKFHFSSNQAFNAIYYYYPFVSATQGTDSANRFLEESRTRVLQSGDFKHRYDKANELGTTLLQQNAGPYSWYHLKNSARIFIEPGKAELDLFTGKLTYGRLYSKQQTGFYDTWRKHGLAGLGSYLSDNKSISVVLLVLLFNLLRLAGFLLFFSAFRAPGVVKIFIAGFVCYFALAAGPIANTRYFLPVSLIVTCCAVVGLSSRVQKRA